MITSEITRYLVVYTSFIMISLQTKRCFGVPICLWCPPEDGAVGCLLCTHCSGGHESSGPVESPCTQCTTCVQAMRTASPCTPGGDVICERFNTVNGINGATKTTNQRSNNQKYPQTLYMENIRQYRQAMDDVNGNTNIIRHRRIVRSLSTDNDSDDVSSDESREEAPSIDSAEEPLNDALKGEGLFVHSTRIEAGRSHVMLFTSEPDQDDLDSGGTDLGSGETLELTSETPSGDPVTISDWMMTPGEIGEDTSSLYDVTMNTTDDVGDYDNVTEGITEYATDYVTEGITEYATDYVTEDISDNVTEYVTDYKEYDVTVTIAEDEFDREPFSKKVTSEKPDYIVPAKSANDYQLTGIKIGEKEVIGSSASVIMSETSIIITVIIVIVMLSIIGVIIFVIYRRKQKRAKLTKRNGDCHPTTSEEQSKEMELLNTPRDEHQSPDGSTETTPLNVNIEPEVGEDALTENRT